MILAAGNGSRGRAGVFGCQVVPCPGVIRCGQCRWLQFLTGWLARDPPRLGASLQEFVGHPAYGIARLRDDLGRFTFLLGGSDGEALFDR
jgi:hypothetical protein